jgi:hypothetical protein
MIGQKGASSSGYETWIFEAWQKSVVNLEVPEFRLFYVSRTFHADYLPEICSTNTYIVPRFLNDRMSSGDPQ